MDVRVTFNILLEASVEDEFSYIINNRRINDSSTLFSAFKEIFDRSIEPLLSKRHPSDINFVNKQHTGS